MTHPFDMIEVERRCFMDTSNPMHAWAAYSLARVNRVEVPDWVMRYLDFVARGVLSISSDKAKAGSAKDAGPQIARAMGFSSSGAGSGLTAYHDRWKVYGMSVRHRIQLGDKESFAIEFVAEAEGVAPSTVRRGWKKYDRLFPGDAIFPEETIPD